MNSLRSRFEFIPRGYRDTIVLLPGWASDCRIFAPLELPYNYLLAARINFSDFQRELLRALEQNSLKKVILAGWSLGVFLAMEFAAKNTSLVKELLLLSIAREFDRNLLKEIGLKIRKNKRAYLYQFYRDCFSAQDRQGWCWFKKNLFRDYLNNMELDELIAGLDYLSFARLAPRDSSGIDKVKIFHGEEDRITPFLEADSMKSEFKQADFTALTGIGHVCFLNPGFKDKIFHG